MQILFTYSYFNNIVGRRQQGAVIWVIQLSINVPKSAWLTPIDIKWQRQTFWGFPSIVCFNMWMMANGIRFTSAHICPLLAVLMEIAAYSPSDLDVYPTVSNPAPPNHFLFPRSLHQYRNYHGLDFRANLLMFFHVSFYVHRLTLSRHFIYIWFSNFKLILAPRLWIACQASSLNFHRKIMVKFLRNPYCDYFYCLWLKSFHAS